MPKPRDWEAIGRQNQSRGKAFEKLVANRPKKLGLSILLKWIDRTLMRGVSLPDIECVDFPDIVFDCKFVSSEFSAEEKANLLAEAVRKYGTKCVVVCGERRNRARLNEKEITVLLFNVCGMMMMYLDDYLYYLDAVKKGKFST